MLRLAEKPEAYAGEFYGPDPAVFEPGTWYFDLRDRALVYVVRFPRAVRHAARPGRRALRLTVEPDYEDIDRNGRFDPGRDPVRGLKLVPLEPFLLENRRGKTTMKAIVDLAGSDPRSGVVRAAARRRGARAGGRRRCWSSTASASCAGTTSLNRWYSTRQAMRALEQPIDVKRAVYRWHRVLGVLVFAGAALYPRRRWSSATTPAPWCARCAARAIQRCSALILEAVRIFLIVGNVAALLAAAVLVLPPQPAEGRGRLGRPPVQRPRSRPRRWTSCATSPDDFVRGRPKLVGAVWSLGQPVRRWSPSAC